MCIIKELIRKKYLKLLALLPILPQNNSALIPSPASQFTLNFVSRGRGVSPENQKYRGVTGAVLCRGLVTVMAFFDELMSIVSNLLLFFFFKHVIETAVVFFYLKNRP